VKIEIRGGRAGLTASKLAPTMVMGDS
jgi:hypothetical protein